MWHRATWTPAVGCATPLSTMSRSSLPLHSPLGSHPHGLLSQSARRRHAAGGCQVDRCLNEDMCLHETAAHTVPPWSRLVDTTGFAPAHLLAGRAQETSSFHSLAHKCTASWCQPCRIYKQAGKLLCSMPLVPTLHLVLGYLEVSHAAAGGELCCSAARRSDPDGRDIKPRASPIVRPLSCALFLFFFWSPCFHTAPVSSTTKRHCADYNARCSPRRRPIVTRTIELLEAASRQTLSYLASIFSSTWHRSLPRPPFVSRPTRKPTSTISPAFRICKTDPGRPRADYIVHHSSLPAVIQHNHSSLSYP